MSQIYITGYGGPEKLQVRESPDPQPQGNELPMTYSQSMTYATVTPAG